MNLLFPRESHARDRRPDGSLPLDVIASGKSVLHINLRVYSFEKGMMAVMGYISATKEP